MCRFRESEGQDYTVGKKRVCEKNRNERKNRGEENGGEKKEKGVINIKLEKGGERERERREEKKRGGGRACRYNLLIDVVVGWFLNVLVNY